ncbi:MAG TPA: C39 family peptidase [Stellaceae bacterium]|nr:C39 family peptidase [Stellaceae bacterium]
MRPALGLALCISFALSGAALDGAHARGDDRKGPVKSLLEMRHDGAIVQQWDLSCGAAALATLLNFQFDDKVTEREVATGLIRRKEYIDNPNLVRVRQGFSLLDMKRYVESRGYVGIGYGKLQLDELPKLAPIIVAINPVGYNHFVVFRGIEGGSVLLADPAFGNRTMTLEKFERVWIDFPVFGRVGFIVSRDGNPAPPGRLAPRPDQFVAPSTQALRQVLPF